MSSERPCAPKNSTASACARAQAAHLLLVTATCPPALARHELQAAVRAEVQHRVRLRARAGSTPAVSHCDMPACSPGMNSQAAVRAEVRHRVRPAHMHRQHNRLVGGKAVVPRGGSGKQQAHGVERGLRPEPYKP